MKNANSTGRSVTKQAARTLAKNFRAGLSAADYAQRSARIDKRLGELIKHISPQSVHVYKPMQRHREVLIPDTTSMLEASTISVFIQSIEPIFPESQFDVVILPGLAVDEHGNRVGYGAGSYDRFLASQDHAIHICVCYDELVFGDIEIEPHDQLLQYIVTETQTIEI